MKLVFRYHVKYPRTINWYDGDWRELSDWCSSSIGKSAKDWEYMDNSFFFYQ
jgi:hypothetical protein